MARWRSSLALLAACSLHPAAPPVVCDGHLDEPAWRGAVRTGPFRDPATGAPAAPYSDARFVVTRDAIYAGLYAADEDVRSDDAFELELGASGARRVRLGPRDRGPDVGLDLDGTLDDPRDLDEEWIVEARLPRAGLPPGDLPVVVRRCDTPKDGVRRCGEGRATLRLP